MESYFQDVYQTRAISIISMLYVRATILIGCAHIFADSHTNFNTINDLIRKERNTLERLI